MSQDVPEVPFSAMSEAAGEDPRAEPLQQALASQAEQVRRCSRARGGGWGYVFQLVFGRLRWRRAAGALPLSCMPCYSLLAYEGEGERARVRLSMVKQPYTEAPTARSSRQSAGGRRV